MVQSKDLLLKQAIARSFSAAATTYDRAAYVEQEVGRRLLDRLACINITPLRILDLGCGTGYFTQQLQALFPQASIIGIDLAFGMVNYASQQRTANNINYYCADAEQLPFAANYFDLIFANCCFMSANNLNNISRELQRVLNISGLLLFTTFGPDTLKEFDLGVGWLDMHNVGDIFLRAQFSDPVVDVETLTINYQSLKDLLTDLNESGSYEIDNLAQVPKLAAPCSATFEVIYGHAWGKQALQHQFTDSNGRVFIAADQIKVL